MEGMRKGSIGSIGIDVCDFIAQEAGDFGWELMQIGFKVREFFSISRVSQPDLSFTKGDRRFESFFSPEVVETGEEHHGAEISDGPKGADDPSDSGLEKAGRQTHNFINVFESGESSFAGGEDSESDAAVLGEVEGKEVF